MVKCVVASINDAHCQLPTLRCSHYIQHLTLKATAKRHRPKKHLLKRDLRRRGTLQLDDL